MNSPRNVLQYLKSQDDLCATVEAESTKHTLPPMDITEFEKLSSFEEDKIEKLTFAEELKFSTPVNLKSSKKAFLFLLRNLEENDNLLKPFTLSLYMYAPHPLEGIEPAVFENMRDTI